MRKLFKIAGRIALGLLVLAGIIVVWALVDIRLNGLPQDSPPVVETGDYRFEAPSNWITSCDHKAPGCLAVLVDAVTWGSRSYWIEVQAVDASSDSTRSLVQRSLDAIAPVVAAAGGDSTGLTPVDPEPVSFEGVQMVDVVDSSAKRFSRSRVVQLPAGNILRFTCYGEKNREVDEHNGACLAALNQLHFPESARLSAAAAAEEQNRQQEAEARRAQAAAMPPRAVTQAQDKPPVATTGGKDVIEQLNAMIRQSEARLNSSDAAIRERNRQRWKGAGWYEVGTAFGSPASVYSGPYAAEDDCKTAVARNSVDESDIVVPASLGGVGCRRLDSSPNW